MGGHQVADIEKMFRINWPCDSERCENTEKKIFFFSRASFLSSFLQLLSIGAEH